MNEVSKQRRYYEERAKCYDSMCAHDQYDEHYVASAVLCGLIDLYRIKSVLDIGCGTGRSLSYLKQNKSHLNLHGIEPVQALREECYSKGFTNEQVTAGDACDLRFRDGHFDCVSMFGVLHHIPNPDLAIQEAFRVASRMVVISDHNIYGMGSAGTRFIKQAFRALRLRKVLSLLMTKGKGYHDTDWDGIFYPFSICDYFHVIKEQSSKTFTFSTKTPALNLLRNASHIAIVGIKHLPST